ncbi:MAG: molybdenum cofactor guanylyltransferase [Spirulinaceae cyanobacterium]
MEFPSAPSLTALILAGGKSSRLGQDKALLPVNTEPMLHRTCQIAKGCSEQVYVVTSCPEKYQEIVPEGCDFIKEKSPDGPLVALSQALPQVKTDWVLVLACDLPKLEPGILNQGVISLTSISPETIALLPRDKQGWQPLCGFYRSSCLPQLQAYLEAGGRSFQGWLDQHPVQELPLKDKEILFNCNTPEDLAELRKGQCLEP